MSSRYWKAFWKQYGEKSNQLDVHSMVLRTLNQKPIEEDKWQRTLTWIKAQLQLSESSRVLDLCCGNGLIAMALAPHCKNVIAIDISADLLAMINLLKHPNIRTIEQDILCLDLTPKSFELAIMYASIQYFDRSETVSLFRKIYDWLSDDGVFYLGDVPDMDSIWTFFNTPKRRAAYFESLSRGEPIVGQWFDREFMRLLAKDVGFSSVELIEQPDEMIYSFFRYDILLRR